MKLFDLSGRTALITGSSRGIGLALATGLADAGARVVLNARDKNRLEAAAKEIKARGREAAISTFDVGDQAAVHKGVEAIESEVGPIDILVNNAGMQHRALLVDFPEEKWHEIFRVNVDSAFFVSRAVARGMIARKRGKVINIASIQSDIARANTTPYAATKGAIRQMTKGMACEFAPHGIQVNAIAPGYFSTELTAKLVNDPEFTAWLGKRVPAGRWGKPEELVGAAIFLASDAATFVTGHMLFVDGGLTATV